MSENILTPDNTTYMSADITYAYDDAYRLTGEARTGYAPYNGTPYTYAKTYTYDAVGNRLTKVDGSTTTHYHYDYDYDYPGGLSTNKLMDYGPSNTPESPSNTLLSYDDAGNLMSDQSNGKTFAYATSNLLASVTHENAQSPSASAWDGGSNRVAFSSSQDGTTGFMYDTTADIPAVTEEVLPSESAVYYIREPNGSLIARVAGEAIQYYHFDALGSTRLLTNASGAVMDSYSYDAWGNMTNHIGTTQQPYQYVGELGYYTHSQDGNLILLQLGVRFYDPELGRFTQRDPARYGRNMYAYVDNAPTALVDPKGLWPGMHPVPIPGPLKNGGCVKTATTLLTPSSCWDPLAILNCDICCLELEQYLDRRGIKGAHNWMTTCAIACYGGPFTPWTTLPRVWSWW